MDYPYATRNIPPIPGTIKAAFEDFLVEEIPLYSPCGQGDHTYFTIEKRGLTTHQAVRDVARALGIKPRNIGVAGNKDSRGVTRQTMSVEHVSPQKITSLDIPRMSVINVNRHRNKLRTGHLWGNRFTIKLRNTDISRIDDVNSILNRLHNTGAPNYYGPQRFGNRGDTWEIGQALLRNDFETAVHIIAGRPSDKDTGSVAEARKLFDAGDYKASAAAWPNGFQECVSVAKAMVRFQSDYERTIRSLHTKTLGLYISAFQSKIFNQVLAARIDGLHTIKLGDVAWKHENGACFLVDDPAAEQERANQFEISPTGPLFGKRMKSPTHKVADLENSMLKETGLSPETLPHKGPFKCPGGRRSLRFRPHDGTASIGEDKTGSFIRLSFSLQAGCYATAVLREICKTELISMTR